MSNETRLQHKIIKFCKKNHCLAYKFSSPSSRGVPDLIIINRSGKVLFMELKSPTGLGRLSELQKTIIEKFWNYQVPVVVISKFDAAKQFIINFSKADNEE